MLTKADIQSINVNHRILVRSNDYIYLLPHPALRNWISNYTITFPNRSIISDNYTVIPHGSATLVFSINQNTLYSTLFGPATKTCIVGNHANKSNMLFIIEFQPAGLYAFTGEIQKELTDYNIPFEMVNTMLCKLITEQVCDACNINELISGIDRLLLSNLHAAYPKEFSMAAKMIIENIGNISVKELSGSVYYSERHLNRIFEIYLGMSIKTFSRLVRINKAIRILYNPRNSITHACDSVGFYDLSHFINDFKSVCGLTPCEYRVNMSDFYNEIAKY